MSSPSANAPVLDIDPFSYESLSRPLELDKTIREAGDIVWLSKYNIWATGRFHVVEAIFSDYETFESSSGTGLTNIKKETNWRKPSLILETDPPLHDKYRKIMAAVLGPSAVKEYSQKFQETADELVASIAKKKDIDAAKDIAEAYPLSVLPDAVGFSKEGRQHLLPYSNLNFQSMGPRNEFYEQAVEGAQQAQEYVTWQMRRESLTPGGLGDRMYEIAMADGVCEEDAGLLVRTFLSAGVDTTIYAIQFALKELAENPLAWQALKNEPSLARQVFEETLRLHATSPYIGRTTSKPTTISGVQLGAGEKVLLLLGAANLDGSPEDKLDVFDINRSSRRHLTFGFGVHSCVGQMFARLEGVCILTAIAEQLSTLEITGEPVLKYSNWLRGFESLPMRVS